MIPGAATAAGGSGVGAGSVGVGAGANVGLGVTVGEPAATTVGTVVGLGVAVGAPATASVGTGVDTIVGLGVAVAEAPQPDARIARIASTASPTNMIFLPRRLFISKSPKHQLKRPGAKVDLPAAGSLPARI